MFHGDTEGKHGIPAAPFELPMSKTADLLGILILQTQNLLAEYVCSVQGLIQDGLTVLVVIHGLF